MRVRQKHVTLMMACGSIALIATISATLSAKQAATPASTPPAATSATAATPARELVGTYCVTCHNDRVKTANLALDKADAEHVFNSGETWEKVVVKLRSRSMPPPGARRPDNATYDRVATWLENELDRAAAAQVNPGRSAELHRLNRTEYANAVRDLLGVEIEPKAMLPPDEQAYGFDTNADALSMQPALLDRYLAAAAKIARLAVGDPTIPAGFERYTALKDNSNESTWLWQNERLGEEFPLGSRGGIVARHYFPVDGEYVFKIRLDRTDTGLIRGLQARNDIEIRIDGARVGQLTVGGTPEFAAGNANANGNPGFTSIKFSASSDNFSNGASDVFSVVVNNFNSNATIPVQGKAGITEETFTFLLSQTTCPPHSVPGLSNWLSGSWNRFLAWLAPRKAVSENQTAVDGKSPSGNPGAAINFKPENSNLPAISHDGTLNWRWVSQGQRSSDTHR